MNEAVIVINLVACLVVLVCLVSVGKKWKIIMIKLSEVKVLVANATKANKEAFAEIGTKIADLNKQIADLIAGVGDPEVTDEAFEADLRSLATDAAALADIVPGSPTPTPEPPVE